MKNPFKIGDVVCCTMYREDNEMTVIEIDGKKIVGRHIDHKNKKIFETKGDFNIFKMAGKNIFDENGYMYAVNEWPIIYLKI